METYRRHLHRRGATIDTDASAATRLSQRPVPSQDNGATYEDLGSDFGSRNARSRARSTSRTSTTAVSKSGVPSRGVQIAFDDDSSDDEIDFLSGSSRHGSETPKRPSKTKPVSAARAPAIVVIDRHQANPGWKPIDLKKMKIPKKGSPSASMQTPENSQESHVRPSDAGSSSSSRVPPRPRPGNRTVCPSDSERSPPRKKVPLRERSPNQEGSHSRRSTTPTVDKEDPSKGESRDMDKTPRPSRPAPRPVNKSTRSSIGKSQTLPDVATFSSQEMKRQSLSRSQSTQEYTCISSDSSDDPKANPQQRKVSGKGKGKAGTIPDKNSRKGRANPFRDISPLSSRVDEAVAEKRMSIGSRLKGVMNGKERADPIGDLSPLTSPARPVRTDTLSSFPVLSPLSSPGIRRSSTPPRAKLKHVNHKSNCVVSSCSEEEDDSPQPILRPFPMQTQDLANLREGSASQPVILDSDGEDHTGTYRTRPRVGADKLTLGEDSNSDDEIFLDPSVDPKTLCPWCDERLPSEPTPHLRALIAAAKRLSHRDDRPTNPLGLRAPPGAFVGVCQRHRFERDWIPRAREKGWPTTIEWNKVAGRMARFKGRLKAIVDDIDEDFAPEVAEVRANAASGSQRPRKENEFWQEVVKNVRQQGSRQTAGVRGQFLHFNKTQPGYYGELGYVIIHQTLCNLFPPTGFHPDATLPLTPSDFIALVLVPEAAVQLIVEDLSLPRDKAIENLRQSVEYGVAMFPADEGEGDDTMGGGSRGHRRGGLKSVQLGATEQMFMERARVRRKELEEEERREEEQARRVQGQSSGPPSKSKPKPRPKGKAADAQTDVESAGQASSPPGAGAKRKTRGRSVSRAQGAGSSGRGPGMGSIVIELSSDTTESDVAGPSKRRRKARDATKDDAEATTVEATPKPVKVRPRPRPKQRSTSRTSTIRDDEDSEAVMNMDVEAPSTSRFMPDIASDQKSGAAIRKTPSEYPLHVGDTPRARATAHKSDTLAVIPTPDTSPGNHVGEPPAVKKTPLELARERRRQGTARSPPTSMSLPVKGKAKDEWLPNFRAGNLVPLDSTDDEGEGDVPPAPLFGPGPSSKRPTTRLRGASKTRFGERKDGSWGWLLDDESQTGPMSPSPLEHYTLD